MVDRAGGREPPAAVQIGEWQARREGTHGEMRAICWPTARMKAKVEAAKGRRQNPQQRA